MKNEKSTRISTIWLACAFFAAMLAWAAFYELDQIVTAQGSVMPYNRTQVIQVVDGGVLEKLLVQEGQPVKTGQLLAVLEKERANAGVDEGSSRLAYLRVALIRAQALAGAGQPNFSKIDPRYQAFVDE